MPVTTLSHIKLLLLDVDGVLTDSRIFFNDNGSEIKAFNSKDGLGLRLLMNAGVMVGIITGRKSNALRYRCNDLGIDLLYEGIHDKATLLPEISNHTGISLHDMAFVGDDLVDLPMFARVGVSVAVADAHEAVLQHADIITALKGGRGAVREICDAILKAKGLWDGIVQYYASHQDKLEED